MTKNFRIFILHHLSPSNAWHQTEIGHFVMGGAAQQQESISQMEVLKEMWANNKTRMLLISSLLLQMGQQFSGINAVFYYSTSFFEGVYVCLVFLCSLERTHAVTLFPCLTLFTDSTSTLIRLDNPLVGTTIVGAVNVLATYAVLFLMDRCGRRTLILWSSGVMFLSCIFIVLSLKGVLSNMVALVAVNFYVIFFEFGYVLWYRLCAANMHCLCRRSQSFLRLRS